MLQAWAGDSLCLRLRQFCTSRLHSGWRGASCIGPPLVAWLLLEFFFWSHFSLARGLLGDAPLRIVNLTRRGLSKLYEVVVRT